MRVVRIDRFDDPRIADYRSVSDAEVLRRRRLFVAEGRLVVSRLLETKHDLRSLLLNDASFEALESSLRAVPGDAPVYVCNTGEFANVTGFNLHRGCLALAARPPERSAVDVADRAELMLVLEGLTDPDNVGSVFRNAAAFGVDGVLLSPTCCDPLYRKAVRTSMGSVLRVRYARVESWPGDLKMLKAKGFTIVALTPRSSSIDLATCAPRRPGERLALIVGTEGSGLSDAAQSMADVCVRIRMSGDVDSLNLATATGIALHQFTNRESRTPNPGTS